MVWIRRVRTASGATAVQIAESVDGRRRIVRHVGSARDAAELGLLIEEAQRLVVDDTQGELDLGITPKAVRAQMVPPPAEELFTDGAGVPAVREWVARPRVLKSCNGLLYDALAWIYADLGFDEAVASFWDMETTGQTTSNGGTGLTTAEMQTAATFLEAGWDFIGETENGTDEVWWIDEGQDYPRLWWEQTE